MKVKILKKEDIDRAIADEFINLIKRKPNAVLGCDILEGNLTFLIGFNEEFVDTKR